MDQSRENQPRSLGIFDRLLDFTMKCFKVAALKLMTFGCAFCRGLAICRWLSNLIIQNLAAQATKPVTLGPPMHHRSPHVPNLGPSTDLADYESEQSIFISTNNGLSQDRKGLEPIQDEDKTDHKKKPDYETQVKGPPKKMVSINDRAEVVVFSTKKKRTKSMDKLPSMESENDEEPKPKPKPIKSILKVRSNVK